jgi:hypothetical protein
MATMMIMMIMPCLECEAWFNFIRDHGYDKCRIRQITGQLDPTEEEIRDMEDAAALFIEHYQEMHNNNINV